MEVNTNFLAQDSRNRYIRYFIEVTYNGADPPTRRKVISGPMTFNNNTPQFEHLSRCVT